MMKSFPQLANIKECTGCLACIDSCPTQSLIKTINNEGHFTYQLNQDTCIKCGKCERNCPVITKFEYGNNSFSQSPIFASWAIDLPLRKNSSSGGVFAAIATYILKKKGIVIGATMDGVTCKHIEISNLSDLYKLQGSKYTQSDTAGIYKLTQDRLKEGKTVLFSGVPCQIAALLLFIKDKELKKNLYTIDIVCGGVPSYFLIQTFINQDKYHVKEILSFRNKNNGWKSSGYKYQLTIKDTNNKIIPITSKKNIITDGFASGLTNRYSCNDCHFAFAHKICDFTLADLWGDKDFPKEHFNGISSISAHTEKGLLLLHKINGEYIKLNPTSWKKILPHNPRYIYGKTSYNKRPERIYLSWIFKHCSIKTINKIYASDDLRFYDLIGNIYRIIKKILATIEMKKKKKFINQIIKDIK